MYRIVEQGTDHPPVHVHGDVPPVGTIIRSTVEVHSMEPETVTSYEVVDIQWELSGPTHRATMAATVVVVEVE